MNRTGGELRAILLALLVGVFVIVPRTIQTLTAPKYRTGVTDEAQPYTFWAGLTLDVLGAAVLAYALFLFIDGLARNHHRRILPLVVLLLPWLYLELRDWTVGAPLRWTPLVYPAVLVAFWALRPGRRTVATLGYLVAALAVISIVIGLAVPSQGTLRNASGLMLTENKTLLPLGILVGIFTHGNNLGQFLVLGLPAVALIRRAGHRLLAFGLVGFALVWSASRSALATAAVLLVALVLLSLLPAARRAIPVRVVLVGAFALVVVVPLLTTSPVAFNNRGGIWGASLLAWRAEPTWGWGSRYYSELAQTTENLGGTAFHGHNQLVQLLVTGGLVLVALVLGLLAAAIERTARRVARDGLFATSFLLALAGASVLEPSMAIVDGSILFPVFVLSLGVVLLGDLRPEPRAAPRPVRVSPPQTAAGTDVGVLLR